MVPPTSDDLRKHAERHVTYEVTALANQVQRLKATRDDVLARALLEASLAHLRVLDDFFRFEAPRPPVTCQECGHEVFPAADDITAQHYLPSWDRRGERNRVLTAKVRDRLNAQLPHLALRREDGHRWDIGPMAVRACDAVVAFVDQLRATDPERAAWFGDAYRRAAELTRPEPVRLGFMSMVASTT
jgi:hypothetical protein